jgi:protoporphyrinogen oxidase
LKVGIIGAGAAGLAAAYKLAKQGHSVAVYERAPFLGGQASTFDVGGKPLERGYHHLFTSDTDIIDLIGEIGLGHQIRRIDSTVGTLHDGRIYNFVTPLDLLKYRPLSLIDRFRLGLATLYLQRQKDYRKYENVTAAEWLRKHSGKGAYEKFWGPMLRGKFGEEFYEQISMAWIWGKVHTRVASRGKSMVKEQLVYPIGSFGEVFDVLTEKIRELGGEVHTSASVERIVVEDGKAKGMEVKLQGREPESIGFDAVIATTPSYIFPRLVPPMPDEYMARLTGVKYLAAVLVILVLDRPLSHVYWLNVPDRSVPFVAVIEQTNLIPASHYGGKHIVYLSNYLSASHPYYAMDKEQILQEYLPHLQKINPEFDLSWIQESYHHKVDAAQPIIETGYSLRLPDHRTPFEGVYLANTTQIYPEDRGTNYSVRMGNKVAGMVVADFAKGEKS